MKYIISILFLFISFLSSFSQTRINGKEKDLIEMISGHWKMKVPFYFFWVENNTIYKLKINNDSTGSFTSNSIDFAPDVSLQKTQKTYYICHHSDLFKETGVKCNRIVAVNRKKLVMDYGMSINIKYKKIE